MQGKKIYMYVLLLTFLVLSCLNINGSSLVANMQTLQTPTTIYIDPQLTVTRTDVIFSVNVSVAGVNDLCSWQVYIYFKNEILEAIEYAEGPFLKSHGSTMFDGSFDNNHNATHGELWMYCLRAWPGYGVDGNGTLATATFKAKLGGTSPLTLANTILGNSTAQRIPHTTTDGIVYVGGHDVAIISVVPYKTIVGQGYPMKINATVENHGEYSETFNITTYANTTVVQTKTITLESGASATVTFTWNTAGFAKGNYTISAVADTIVGETRTDDNTHVADECVCVSMPGDLDCDRDVDLYDAVKLLKRYGTKEGQPEYDPVCDIDGDGDIDLYDAVTLLTHYGEKDP